MLSAPGAGTVLTCVGAVLFFVSDCVLFLMQYDAKKPRCCNYVAVMATYTSAVLLVTVGLVPFC